jgi:hypothetical protein
LEWKSLIGGAQTTYEVILECLNGAFGGIDAVVIGFYELPCAVLGV